MKKGLFFVSGLVTGVVIAFLAVFVLSIYFGKNTEQVADKKSELGLETVADNEDDGVVIFDEPGDIIEEKSFEVFQVVESNAALVRGKSSYSDLYIGTVYLLVNNKGKYYYDDEIVKVPHGKDVRQIGIYQYLTKNEIKKTVPIIAIMNK